jgi:uncharacterized protein (DUF1501 family)
MTTTRRDFLAAGLAAGSALPWVTRTPGAAASTGNAVVLIQIVGGWDYLSLLFPPDDPVYREARPRLAIARGQAHQIESGWDWYWHPRMGAFKRLYDAGRLAIVQNVGYPNPDLSHFASIDRWDSARPGQTLQRGWLARYLDAIGGGGPFHAVEIGALLSGTFLGAPVPAILDVPEFQLHFDWFANEDDYIEELLIHYGAILAEQQHRLPETRAAARRFIQAHQEAAFVQSRTGGYNPRANYPEGDLSTALKVVARLLVGGMPTQVFKVSLSGFDTHAGQIYLGRPTEGPLANLLANVADATEAFLTDVAAHGHGQRVVVMLYSEFGRRVTENGSLGTDHGHGGVAFLAGERVNGGRYGASPDLAAIRQPGQSYYIPFDGRSTDFRRLYATVLESWLGVQSQQILDGVFPPLGAL